METNVILPFLDQEPYKSILSILDSITIIVAFATLFFVFINWRNSKKQLQTIPIKINDKLVKSYILRKNFSRAEVKGILRGLCIESEYKIDYIDDEDSTFLKDIHLIQIGKKDELIIPIKSSDTFTFKEKL